MNSPIAHEEGRHAAGPVRLPDRVLAEAVRVGQDRGQRILLCSPSEPVLRIFRLAGFEEVLQCCCADPAETHRRLTS